MKAMREYKIEQDIPADEISDEEIMKYQDFGQLTTNYQDALNRMHKKPLYKDPKAFLGLVLVIIILYLVLDAMEAEEAATAPNGPAPTEETTTD